MSDLQDRCTFAKCDYATTQQCEMGHPSIHACEHRAAQGAEAPAPSEKEGDPALVRWTGRALGTVDLLSAAARGRVTVIGVVGPRDSGKTTFLLAIYLCLLKGHRLGQYRFAGSWTLEAWESLASHARHTFDHAPTFPPHTSRAGRVPGLLHLALRDARGVLHDVVWTDAPGEWFMEWASAEDAPGAEGARWVNRTADAFLLFADCERFAGAERGKAEKDLNDLMHRMERSRRGRPVNLLWTKSDTVEAMPPELKGRVALFRERVEKLRALRLPGSASGGVTVFDEAGQRAILEVSAGLLDNVLAFRATPFELPVVHDADPFLTYRGTP
jgi:hypothetical protein